MNDSQAIVPIKCKNPQTYLVVSLQSRPYKPPVTFYLGPLPVQSKSPPCNSCSYQLWGAWLLLRFCFSKRRILQPSLFIPAVGDFAFVSADERFRNRLGTHQPRGASLLFQQAKGFATIFIHNDRRKLYLHICKRKTMATRDYFSLQTGGI